MMFTRGWSCAISALGIYLSASLTLAEGSRHGVIKPVETVKFEQDEDVKCLQSSLESGDPSTGPSSFILKAPPGCLIPWHFHTAEEQLIVVRGLVVTEMQGETATQLRSGGYAMMPGGAPHQFACKGKVPCLMHVIFDSRYDITWGKSH